MFRVALALASVQERGARASSADGCRAGTASSTQLEPLPRTHAMDASQRAHMLVALGAPWAKPRRAHPPKYLLGTLALLLPERFQLALPRLSRQQTDYNRATFTVESFTIERLLSMPGRQMGQLTH